MLVRFCETRRCRRTWGCNPVAFLDCGVKFRMVMVPAFSRAFIRVLLQGKDPLISLPLLFCNMVCMTIRTQWVHFLTFLKAIHTKAETHGMCHRWYPRSKTDLYSCRLALWTAIVALPRAHSSGVVMLDVQPLFEPLIRTTGWSSRARTLCPIFPMHLLNDCWVWTGMDNCAATTTMHAPWIENLTSLANNSSINCVLLSDSTILFANEETNASRSWSRSTASLETPPYRWSITSSIFSTFCSGIFLSRSHDETPSLQVVVSHTELQLLYYPDFFWQLLPNNLLVSNRAIWLHCWWSARTPSHCVAPLANQTKKLHRALVSVSVRKKVFSVRSAS